MKKILVFMLCVILLCSMPIVVFAEGESTDAVVEEGVVTESVSEKTVTETIVDYVKSHVEELSVIFTLLLTVFYEVRKHRTLNGSIGTLNNNAITVAEKSETAIKQALGEASTIAGNSVESIKIALQEVADIAAVVKGYKEDFEKLLDEVRKNADEKQSLEDILNKVEAFLKTSKLASIELANEVAELLVLANIPNSKKEELYARHTKAVHELAEAEGVIANDGKEA